MNLNSRLVPLFVAASLLAVSALACAFQTEKVIVVTATKEPEQVAQVATTPANTPPPLPSATLASTTTASPTRPAATATRPAPTPTKAAVAQPAPTPTDISRVPSGSVGQGITAMFVFPGSSLNATRDLTFRLIAYLQDGPKTDGAGIKQVEFRICRDNCDDENNVVYRRVEQNAAYCAFGGGEPDCNIFHFSRGAYWPDTNTPVQSGNYAIEARVTPKNGDAYWQGQIEFKIQAP